MLFLLINQNNLDTISVLHKIVKEIGWHSSGDKFLKISRIPIDFLWDTELIPVSMILTLVNLRCKFHFQDNADILL